MNQDTQPAVRLDSVTRVFPGHSGPLTAVDDTSLTIQPGSVVAVLGPNGAGKTTTLDMILGLVSPTSGTITVLGLAPREAVRTGRISALLQSGGLLRDLKVGETVELIASTFDDPIPPVEALRRAGIEQIAQRKVAKCSGGEQQRLRFALALLPDPDLLILDEPTTGMDVTARHEFWKTMHAEARRGRTILFATHYLEEADAFAERIIMMNHGRIVADGTTRQIRTHVSGRVVSARIGAETSPEVIAKLQARPDVHSVTTVGERIVVHTSDSDAVALELLTTLGGHELEVAPGSLDEAFTALTSGDAAPRASADHEPEGADR